jgi:hypothetical protein
MIVDKIIGKEILIERVNGILMQLRMELIDKGYAKDEANTAIAGALPNCIAAALIDFSENGKKLLK